MQKTLHLCCILFIVSVIGQGAAEKYILHGHPCPVTDHPYAIAIFHRCLQPHYYHCNGALIKWNWVLTTASCLTHMKDGESLTPVGFWVSAGCTEIYTNGTQTRDVERVAYHRDFSPKKYAANDIGALKTTEKFHSRSDCQTVPMLPPCSPHGQCENITTYCSYATAMSFGWNCQRGTCDRYTGQLLCISIWPISHDVCYRSKHDREHLPDTLFCAMTEGEYACYLDQGGPVSCRGTLVGLIARRDACRIRDHDVEYFTRLNSVMDFILNTTWEYPGEQSNRKKKRKSNADILKPTCFALMGLASAIIYRLC